MLGSVLAMLSHDSPIPPLVRVNVAVIAHSTRRFATDSTLELYLIPPGRRAHPKSLPNSVISLGGRA